MNKLHNNVPLLSLCVALTMSGASLIVATSALVGFELAEDKSLATLPLAVQFIGTMFASIPAAMLMQRIGRKAAFMLATLFAISGGVLAAVAIMQHNFWLFVFATYCVGTYNGFSNYYRFAAADSVDIPDKSRAVSWVMVGGIIAAVLGPTLARLSREWVNDAEFAGSYLAIIVLYVIVLSILSFLKIEHIPNKSGVPQDTGRPLLEIVSQARYKVAVICGMLGYGVMTFVMTATPLAMSQRSFQFDSTAFVIQWHVLAMFGPSLFTGNLIARFGVLKIMSLGAILGLGCVVINLNGSSWYHFFTALVLLGISWNMLFVGATTLITETYRPEEKNKAQAVNDFLIFTTVAVASLSAGALQNAYGWESVNRGVVPLLVTILASIIWLSRKSKPVATVQEV